MVDRGGASARLGLQLQALADGLLAPASQARLDDLLERLWIFDADDWMHLLSGKPTGLRAEITMTPEATAMPAKR